MDETFHVIARLIREGIPEADGFVPHDAIVASILADDEGLRLVQRARERKEWTDDRSVASKMVAWFSQYITTERSQWAEWFDRTRVGNVYAYRPKAELQALIDAERAHTAIEGDVRLVLHVKRERDPKVAAAKREEVRACWGHERCEACGFTPSAVYPGLQGEVCEVHHLRPLSEASESVLTRIEDLALLCANCHRAIHRTQPLLSVDEFRLRFFGEHRECHSKRPPEN